MAGNTFGKYFRIMTFGESHGPALGVVMDGVRPGMRFSITAIQKELDRRRPGRARSRPRATSRTGGGVERRVRGEDHGDAYLHDHPQYRSAAGGVREDQDACSVRAMPDTPIWQSTVSWTIAAVDGRPDGRPRRVSLRAPLRRNSCWRRGSRSSHIRRRSAGSGRSGSSLK